MKDDMERKEKQRKGLDATARSRTSFESSIGIRGYRTATDRCAIL